MDRRRFLAAISGVLAAGALAGCSGDSDDGDGTAVDADPDQTPTTAEETLRPGTTVTTGGRFGAWFATTENYDGVIDRRDRDEVTVEVGVAGNGGNLAYSPAAIAVTTGTTVVWEWTGEGGQHNVVEQDGGFESALTDEAGHTFSNRFRTPQTALYYCVPHRSVGMRGAVVVEES